MATIGAPAPRASGRVRLSAGWREALWCYTFLSPWLLGFLVFTAGPIVAVFYLGFTRYNVFKAPLWVGLENYVGIFTDDRLFTITLLNTIYFVVISVPGQLLIAFTLALFLNTRIHGRGAYRTLFYLPMIVPHAAASVIFLWLLHAELGVVKHLLDIFGIPSPLWFQDEDWSKPGIILLSFWYVGQTMVIMLAGLQNIPTHLYEAAAIDGANTLRRMWHVTIPMLSPTTFFLLVIGLVTHFQVFTFAYIMTRGGPLNSTLFYVLYLYRYAFKNFEMGYASAMATVLFVLVLAVTGLTFGTSRHWVHYET